EVEIAAYDGSARVRQSGRHIKRQQSPRAIKKRITYLVVRALQHQHRSMNLSTGAIGKKCPCEATPYMRTVPTSRSSPSSTRSYSRARVTLAQRLRRTSRYGLRPPVPISGSNRSGCSGPQTTSSSTLVMKRRILFDASPSTYSRVARNG